MSSISSASTRSIGHDIDRSSVPGATLDILIPHLLASKRSLSTVQFVFRANDLCHATRDVVETAVIRKAQTAYMRRGIRAQIHVLYHLWQQTNHAATKVHEELDVITKALDDAEERLSHTMDELKSTSVAPQLRPEGEERKCLLDFVDETAVQGLVMSTRKIVQQLADQTESHAAESSTFRAKTDNLCEVLDNGQGNRISHVQASDSDPGAILPKALQDMEILARGMADNLEGLVNHFDLCVKAVKHIDGGNEVALEIAGDVPEGVDMRQYSTPMPMSPEDYVELMAVLHEDAAQVDDVVMEIRSQNDSMESIMKSIEPYIMSTEQDYTKTIDAFDRMQNVGEDLNNHVRIQHSFIESWKKAKYTVDEMFQNLDEAGAFYKGFLRAYDCLIIEVGRRKVTESMTDKTIQTMTTQLDKIYEDDLASRLNFTAEQGDFLPVDIWPGLVDAPLRYTLNRDEGRREPDISKSTIHRAIRRIHGPAL